MVEAFKAIQFTCEECGEVNFAEDSLDYQWLENRHVREDKIACTKCGHDNHVVEEL